MANEYAVNQSDLTIVADAIRTKGETSAQLVFPDGFVTAIGDIKTGAELNFEVVGGTSRPANPKENTIWVNTSTAISGWAFGTKEDISSSPANGAVLFVIDSANKTKFNALKENYIYMHTATAYQYISGTLKTVNAEIYQGGAWKKLRENRVFDNGNQITEITGGWSNSGYALSGFNHTNITRVSIGTSLVATAYCPGAAADSGGLLGTKNPININGFTTMRVKGNLTGYYHRAKLLVGVHTSKTITASPLACIDITTQGNFERTLALPTSATSVYVFVLAGCHTGTNNAYTATLSVSSIVLE